MRVEVCFSINRRRRLKRVGAEALGSNPYDGAAIAAKMKALPTYDPLFGKRATRADGRAILPAYVFEVKQPSEPKGAWDYYKLLTPIPEEEAFPPISDSKRPLVRP